MFKPRPSPIQTNPKSKTSNVWARGGKSDDRDFRKSTCEGSGKECWLSFTQGVSGCLTSQDFQPVLRDFSLPPETHTTN